MIAVFGNLARALAPVVLTLFFCFVLFCLFVCLFVFFDTTNRYEVFLTRPKSHNLRTETKCLKLSPEGFCEIPPQKQS